MSASDSDAAITTAASVGWGRSRSRPGTTSSIAAIAAAPTRPVTCVLAPACSATAVRDPLVLTGNPWNSPAPMLAAPIPTISRLPLTSSPARSANADAVAIVSASETSAMPSAPATSVGQVGAADVGHGERREALRQRPHQLHAVVGEVEQVGGEDRDDDRDQHSRHLRQEAPAGRRSAPGRAARSRAPPRPSRRLDTPSTNACASAISPLASVENPNSLGSWPTRIVDARPFM